jgi:DNA excision repair protein ERCC-2
MHFSIDDRTCALNVGEFAGFNLGPRDAGQGGPSGLWRVQLGQEWHARLRARTEAEVAAKNQDATRADAAFEVPLTLPCMHRGWTFKLSGRIDQLLTVFNLSPGGGGRTPAVSIIIREIKTVSGPLPADASMLRADYPEYFLQAIAYLALLRSAPRRSQDRPAADVPGDRGNFLPLELGPTAGAALQAELIFVEIGTGITQTVALGADDETSFYAQLERLAEFLDLQVRARDRLRGLQFRPAFAELRPGQETVQDELLAAFRDRAAAQASATEGLAPVHSSSPAHAPPVVFFEAPTGYGKTGVLLEFALGRLRAGRFGRLLYLTSKSTGQLQVMHTLAGMCTSAADTGRRATPVTAWQVRPKSEHCVNTVYHCVRDACPFLADLEARWKQSGLARFYLFENQPRDLESLRAAGRDARLCPYEITRAALPFNDVWIGDYNYVFAPDSRGIFFDRPGFNPDQTLLVVDEAHNLPARVADAHSHVARSADAEFVLAELHRIRAASPLLLAWEHWTRLLAALHHTECLDLAAEDDVRDAIDRLAGLIANTPMDFAALGPNVSGQLWKTLALRDWLEGNLEELADPKPRTQNPRPPIPTLLWCPRAGELNLTCLDAAALIGRTLRVFGGVILASATLQPTEVFAANCGIDEIRAESAPPDPMAPPASLGRLSRRARKTLRGLTSGTGLLKVEEARETAGPQLLRAAAPWRENAYAVGIDTRIDTSFQHRVRFYASTAATVESLVAAARLAAESRDATPGSHTPPPPLTRLASPSAIAVFFPSYAYADNIVRALQAGASGVRVALQPRGVDLAAQAAWVRDSLAQADALFLVLGSSFAESIDLLGGRITHAMVVGPALPEVNAIQRSRLAELERTGLGRTAAFRRVYQIPGMQKVNQALGRLVRAPGQRARVLLHCRRFAEPSYATLLSTEYRDGVVIRRDEDLTRWLQGQS